MNGEECRLSAKEGIWQTGMMSGHCLLLQMSAVILSSLLVTPLLSSPHYVLYVFNLSVIHF